MGADPVSWALIGGAVLSAGATIQSGRAHAAAMEADAAAQTQAATDRQRQAAVDGVTLQRDKRRFMARQIAALNGMGAPVGSGTALALAETAARDAELDFLNTIAAGDNDARALRRDAAMNRSNARATRVNALFGGAATLLNGYSRWAQYEPE